MTTIANATSTYQGIDALSEATPAASGLLLNELADYGASFRGWFPRLPAERPSEQRELSPKISIVGPLPSAVRQIVVQLNQALALLRNWDSYGGKPASTTAAVSALSWIIEVYQSGLPAPSVVPGSDGSIQLEWHVHDIDFEVLFSPSGAREFVFEDHNAGREVEGSLSIQNMAGREFVDQLVARATC